MLPLAVLAVIALFVIAPQQSTDHDDYECTLDFDAQHSFIDTNAPGVRVIEPEERDPQELWLTQTVQLANGTQVKLGLGGCAHYGYALGFRNIPGVPNHAHPTLNQIKSALRSVPLVEGSFVNIHAHVTKLKKLPANGEVPCGDAICSIQTEPGSFNFSYDFAL